MYCCPLFWTLPFSVVCLAKWQVSCHKHIHANISSMNISEFLSEGLPSGLSSTGTICYHSLHLPVVSGLQVLLVKPHAHWHCIATLFSLHFQPLKYGIPILSFALCCFMRLPCEKNFSVFLCSPSCQQHLSSPVFPHLCHFLQNCLWHVDPHS